MLLITPHSVAEQFGLLDGLYPSRIDMGLQESPERICSRQVL